MTRDFGFHPNDEIYGETMSDYPSKQNEELPLFSMVAPKPKDENAPTVLLKDLPKPGGGKTLARGSDPGPSHVAAADTAMKLNEIQQMFINGLSELLSEDGAVIVESDGKPVKLICGQDSYTANEVAKFVISDQRGNNLAAETVRKRAGELKKKKVLLTSEKVCAMTGKRVESYRLNAET